MRDLSRPLAQRWALAVNPDSLARLEDGGWKEHGGCQERRKRGDDCWGSEVKGEFAAVADRPVWWGPEGDRGGSFFFLMQTRDGPERRSVRTGRRSGDLAMGAGVTRPVYIDIDDEGGYWAYQMISVPVAGVYPEVRTQVMEGLPLLVQADGQSRRVFSADDGVPMLANRFGVVDGFLRASPDGSVWMTPTGDGEDLESLGPRCDGLVNFDGTTWNHYLAGACIHAIDIAPDGTAWVQAGGSLVRPTSDSVADTYVIRPER